MHRASPCRPPVRSRALSRLGFALLIASVLCRRSDAVVISEIHYHPPEGEDGLEFIELANETTTPVDLSGWAFVEGIELEFPPGTILGSRGHIVVCVDRDAVVGRYGIENAIGNATGRLDNDGERITLVNHAGVIVATLRFRDRGKWPTAPDGTGHTLALRKLWLDPSEPESWAPSAELGGTPGRPNFDEEEEAQPLEVVIDRGAPWRYRRGSAPFSSPSDAWIAPDFDDAAWESGPSGFGFGDDDDATVLDDMQGSYSSVAVRTSFSISALELGAGIEWLLGVDYDDGFVAFVNGVEVARANAGTAGTAPAWDASATGSREAGLEEL
ncbi:MAG TPA: lamin tail domain-containing protein, partial [Planctomycetota bacterium]|nr:lamin tail domain-containing protein [Planctomycetota bacterium]